MEEEIQEEFLICRCVESHSIAATVTLLLARRTYVLSGPSEPHQ
jgi:hypothetical protein